MTEVFFYARDLETAKVLSPRPFRPRTKGKDTKHLNKPKPRQFRHIWNGMLLIPRIDMVFGSQGQITRYRCDLS